MSWVGFVIVLAVVFILGAAGKKIIGEQVESMLVAVPSLLLRWARRRLPESRREDLYREWSGELDQILENSEGFPVNQIYRGVKYSIGLVYAAPIVARELDRARHRSGEMDEIERLVFAIADASRRIDALAAEAADIDSQLADLRAQRAQAAESLQRVAALQMQLAVDGSAVRDSVLLLPQNAERERR